MNSTPSVDGERNDGNRRYARKLLSSNSSDGSELRESARSTSLSHLNINILENARRRVSHSRIIKPPYSYHLTRSSSLLLLFTHRPHSGSCNKDQSQTLVHLHIVWPVRPVPWPRPIPHFCHSIIHHFCPFTGHRGTLYKASQFTTRVGSQERQGISATSQWTVGPQGTGHRLPTRQTAPPRQSPLRAVISPQQ